MIFARQPGFFVRFLLDPYLYECTNKMVLSTKSAERENIKGYGQLAFDPGTA